MEKVKANPWKWMVILLAALNVVLIVFILARKDQERMPAMQRGEGPAKMIIAELKFNETQVKEFEKLKHKHHSSVLEIQEKGKKLRDDFFELLKQENPDSVLISQKSDSISANQKQIELVTFYHFKEVRKLCNVEQKRRFDEIIKDILHTMARPHRRGPPPNGHDGPPPEHEGPPHP